jgi:PAS domain S-box-containing protein
MPDRANNKQQVKRRRHNAIAVRRSKKLSRAPAKMLKQTFRAEEKFSTHKAAARVSKDGASIHSTRSPAMRSPKTELEAATQRFVDLYDFAPIAYVSFGRTGRIEEANLTATELLGEPRDRLIGRPFAFYVADLDLFMQHLLYCRTSEQQVRTELQLKAKKGERIPVLLCSTPITSTSRNGALLYQTAIVDLSERKQAEKALQKSEERLRAIINQSNAGIANCALNGRFLFANWKFREMLGYTDSEMATRTIFTITHPDDVDITKRRFGEMVQKSKPIEIEKRYIRKDGSLIWVNVCDTPVLDGAGKPVSAVAVAFDITQRKKAEDALRKSKTLLEERVRERTRQLRVANKDLQDEIVRRKGLEGEILEISDREQQRLGQEIHDGLCQHLTAVAFMARSIALRLKNHRVIDAGDIEKIAQLVNDAATDTRNLSRALHRIDVDSAGFVTALEDLVDREIWQIPCRLEVKPSFRIEDDVAAGELYRIAREAVINANKHSEGREIVIKLERAGREMVLRVTDDGVGFPRDSKTKRGLGAHIMGYRARLMGARLEIDSPKRGGTRVSCYLPDRAVQSKKGKNNRTQPFPARIVKALATLI